MNTAETKDFVEKNGIVTIKADRSKATAAVNELLHQLGNTGGAIPFYAIFPAGNPNEPILMDGLLSKKRVLEALQQAGPSQMAEGSKRSEQNVTAMRTK